MLLKEELTEARRERDSQSRDPSTSADVAHLLSATEAKYESRIADLKKNIWVLEKERNDGEAEWIRKVREKSRESEDLKRALGSANKSHEKDEEAVIELRAEIVRLRSECRSLQQELSDLRLQGDQIKDIEVSIILSVHRSADSILHSGRPKLKSWSSPQRLRSWNDK